MRAEAPAEGLASAAGRSLMVLNEIDTGAIARSLSQVADRAEDHADVFFEAVDVTTVSGVESSLATHRSGENGLAVRLLRDGATWLASCDGISPESFAEGVARVARARPGAVAPPPRDLAPPPAGNLDTEELETFVAGVGAAVRARHSAFSVEWEVSAHRRSTRVVGTMLAPPAQAESFFSCRVTAPWARWGSLFHRLDRGAIESVADSLTSLFRVRRAEPAPSAEVALVLGPAATAVLLHEAVAHVLEADTLALTGRPEAAIGARLGASGLEVVDDPGRAPEAVRREIDDEGMPVMRRFLLRDGSVGTPLADLAATGRSRELMPGAARRGSRHLPPVPRSHHLELVPPAHPTADPVADCAEGLYVRQFSRGSLDPVTGSIELVFPFAREIRGGALGGLVGAGRIRTSVGQLLHRIAAVGGDPSPAGAGWCAKGGHRLAVWAEAPTIAIDGIGVMP